jgi:ribose transport system substrate-binding protein
MIRKRSGRHHVVAAACAMLAVAFGTSVLVTGTAAANAGHRTRQEKAGLTGPQIKALKRALSSTEGASRFVAPGPALPAAKVKALKGDSIMFLGVGQNTFNTEYLTGVQQAAKAVGMHVIYDNALTAATQVHDIESALAQNAKAIILECIVPTSVSSALLKAKAANATVIVGCTGDPRLPTAKVKALGVFGEVTYSYTQSGRLIGEYDVLKTHGKVDALVQWFKGLGASDDTVAGFKSVLKKYCPKTCSATYADIPLTSSGLTSTLQSSATAAVANPSVNVFFPVYDFMVTDDEPIITSAHANSRIVLATQNADLAPMQEIAAGNTAVRAEVGDPTIWEGWASVDQALRGMLKMAPVANEHVPTRLFDTTNIKHVNLKASMTTWYGPANFRADYERLWGVRK